MKVLVGVERVVDYNVKIRDKADNSGLELADAKMSTNSSDQIGVEEVARFKENGAATEIVAVPLGALQCQETLHTALAMGTDRGLLV